MNIVSPTPQFHSNRPAVYATELTVDVGSKRLLGPMALTVGRGDWVNIIGPNGAGKSTLLRAIAGLRPARGRLEIDGTPLQQLDRRARARQIGLVGQQPEMPGAMTVEQYVLLGRAPHLGVLSAESRRDFDAVDTAIERLELGDLAHRSLGTLSGGERQRVALARAVAQGPSLLLLDEPTTALDIGHQQDALELIDRLRSELGITVVSTMHDLTLAARYGDHLVMLAGGAVVASGPPIQVLTGDHLAEHYGAAVDVIRHRGSLVVVPLRPDSPPAVSRPTGRTDPTDPIELEPTHARTQQ